MENYSDEKLVRNYLKGNEESLEVLVRKYLKPIFSFVFRLVENSQEAEDITQEVFVKAWRNLKKFNQKQSFKTWLFTIAKNTCLDWLRKKKEILFSELERKEKKTLIQNIPDLKPLPDEIFERKDLANLFKEALEKLPLKYKIVLLLRYNDHLTFRQISEIFKEPLNTVKSRHKRAIIQLKKLLLAKVEKLKN